MAVDESGVRNPFESGLDRCAANHVPLSPVSLLARTAAVHPERTAIIHGELRQTWGETCERACRLSSALARLGLGAGDTVAILSPNTPAFVEASFGVPMSGAVLNALNTRLDAAALAFILEHGETRVLLVDGELAPLAAAALDRCQRQILVVDIVDAGDPQAATRERLGSQDYESLLASGDPAAGYGLPADEWQALALNYTSGTTGNPKGVVYSHRGAYLTALNNAITWSMPRFPVYLWTLPMFHCNGWCFPWTITALAGTHVCLRKVSGPAIVDAIVRHGVSHFCGAPVVMGMLCDLPEAERPRFEHPVAMMTAASAPPAVMIERLEAMGVALTHVYGLTEVYGPAVVCAWKPEWDGLEEAERARRKARQGVRYELQEDMMVADPETLAPVPADGRTLGEIMMRGNIMMRGYLKNPEATRKAFAGGWFHTGDLAVLHEDGYVEIKDRSKDIIISGGENISSIEIEGVLYQHPAVATVAVVAKPDERWGETPLAFIELRPGASTTAEEIIGFCRERLAHYKCPRHVRFTEIPKTSTGKIQKILLRERAREL